MFSLIDIPSASRRSSRIMSYFVWVLMVCGCLSLNGCSGGYSFTGASIPEGAKTLSMKPFPNYATTINPQLSQKLYDQLRSMFESQTSLSVTNSDGDLQLFGEITGYSTQASSLSSNDNVATNRFTISIKVKFVNTLDPEADFEQTFARYKDYDASRDFSSVESGLVTEIVNELCEDVFNKSVVNW